MGKDLRRLVGAVEVRVVLRDGIRGRAAVRVHVHPQDGAGEIAAIPEDSESPREPGRRFDLLRSLRPLLSPETVHLLHVVQGDHAVSQDDVQEPVGAEEELATEVLPVQLRHFHQHSHGSSVHLVRVFPADHISAVSGLPHLLINLQSRKSDAF